MTGFMALIALVLSLNAPLVDTSAGPDDFALRVAPDGVNAGVYTVVPDLNDFGVQGFICRRAEPGELPMVKYIAEYRAMGGEIFEDGSCGMAVYGDGSRYRVYQGQFLPIED